MKKLFVIFTLISIFPIFFLWTNAPKNKTTISAEKIEKSNALVTLENGKTPNNQKEQIVSQPFLLFDANQRYDATNCVELYIANDTVCAGSQFCVDVTVGEFVDIVSMQYSLFWDPSILQYQQTQAYNLSGMVSSNFNYIPQGTLQMAWFDPNAQGITLPDGTSIYQICFTTLQNGNATINFSNSPTIIEFADNHQVICSTLNPGNITVGNVPIDCPNCDTISVNPQIIVEENCISYSYPPTDSTCAILCRGFYKPPSQNCIETCDSSIQIYKAALQPNRAYQWKVVGGTILGANNLDSVIIEWGSTTPAEVSLVETDIITGCKDSTLICIEFIKSPTANFSYTPQPSCFNTPIYFNDLSVNANDWFWDFGDGITSNLQHPSHTYASGGTKTVTLIVSNTTKIIGQTDLENCMCNTECSCSDTIQMNIIVDALPGAPINCVGTACVGDTVCYTTPTACANANYDWTIDPNDGVITSGGGLADTFVCVQWLQGQESTISLKVTGCSPAIYCPTPTIAKIPIIDPNALNIEGDTIVCFFENSVYSVPKFPGATYNWFVVGGTILENQPYSNIISVLWQSGTIAEVRLSIEHKKRGCIAQDTLAIIKRPQFNIFGEKMVCPDAQQKYVASPLGNFNWMISGGTIIGPSNNTDTLEVLWDVNAGTYELKAFPVDPTLYCDTVATYFVEILEKPTMPNLVVGPTAICPNGTYEYTATANMPTGNIKWIVEGGTVSPSSGNSALITWNPTGPYQIKLLQESSAKPFCVSDTNRIVVNPITSININGPTMTCHNSTTNYNATTSPSTSLQNTLYDWRIIPIQAGSVINGQGTQNITVQWDNSPNPAKLIVAYCDNTLFDTLDVSFNPATPNITHPTEVCGDSLATINVTGDFSNGATIANVNQSNLVYQPIGSAINPIFKVPGGNCYIFEGVNQHGCTIIDNFCIARTGPTAKISALSDLNICSGSTITLQLAANTSPGGSTYQWQQNCAGSWSDIPLEVTPNLSLFNFSAACSFRILITENNCTDTSNILTTNIITCGSNCDDELHSLDFTASTCGPTINFSINASNNVRIVDWNYGDGSGLASNASHTYTDAGCYNVCLNARVPEMNSNDSCEIQVCKRVNIPMIVDWDHVLDVCSVNGSGATYQFNNLTQFSPKVVATSYLWTFVDGCTGNSTTTTNPFPLEAICGSCNSTATVSLQVTTMDQDGISCTQSNIKMIKLAGSTANANLPIEACVDEKITFQNQSCGGREWLWDFGDGGTSNLENPSKAYTVAGGYTVTLKAIDEYGCESTAFTQNITIHPLPSVHVTKSTDPNLPEVCEGNTITLTATSGFTNYEWLDVTNNISVQSGTSNIFVASSTGVYQVIATDSKNCKNYSDKVPITIHQFPDIEIEGETAICFPDRLDLKAPQDGYTYEWKLQNQSNVLSTGFWFSWSGLQVGNYVYELTLTQTNFPNCSKTFQIPVTVSPNVPQPVVNTNPASPCLGDFVTFSIANYTANYDYVWSTGATGSSIIIDPAEDGPIGVTATDPLTGCSETGTAYVYPLPDICAVPIGCYESCPSDTICVEVPVGTNFEWLKDGVPLAGQFSNCLVVEMSGKYQAVLISQYGCRDTSDFMDYTIIDCDTSSCCKEANNLIANGAFEGYPNGNIMTTSPWNPIHGSPRITNNDGCDSLGSLQIWGNNVVGEAVEQSGLSIQAGYTYRLSFCARYVNSHAQAPPWAQVEIRGSNTTLPYDGCAGNCEVIDTTSKLFTPDWQNFCFDWTPQHNYDRITIRTFNGETIDHGDLVSRVRVDDVCLSLIDSTCVADFNYTLDNCGEICLFDLSTGGFDSTVWQIVYGSGASVIMTNDTCFRLLSQGNYTVCREIYGAQTNCADTLCQNIFVPNICNCKADFNVSFAAGCLKVNLTNTSYGNGNLTYKWLVDGQAFSTAKDTMWMASDTGVYKICLEIEDAIACKDTIWKDIALYDNIKPTIYCPPDTTVFIPLCSQGTEVFFPPPTAFDNCELDTIWCDYESGDFFNCGSTKVTCYAKDIYGNQSTCSFNIHVQCQCAHVFDSNIMCGDSAAGYDFCVFVKKSNGASSDSCTFNISNNQTGVTLDIDNIDWYHPDSAKITGSFGSQRPIPKHLKLDMELSCLCPNNDTVKCQLPVNFITPCCDSIFLNTQEVCKQEEQLYFSLNGTIDFANIAQTNWYIQQGTCPTSPFGGTPYQTSLGYNDLLISPKYFNSDICVYAEIIMANGPCTKLTSNLATIEICQPVTCSLKDTAYCYFGSPITPKPLTINVNQNGQDCDYSVIWLDDNLDTIQGANGLTYQPPPISFVGPADTCSYQVTYTAIINSVCGASRCSASIRLDNNDAAEGLLNLTYPTNTAMPFCPGQDATLVYDPACVGEPPRWAWHMSTDGSNFTALPTAGNQNPVFNTNRLFETTWFRITKQNGVCTILDTTTIKVEVKDSLKINQFSALTIDSCTTNGVNMLVHFSPCTSGTGNSCNCDYNIKWYKNGQVLHTANYSSSPASYNYIDASLNGDYSGNYYVVITDNCCNQTQQSDLVKIDPPMEVIATGPCFQCFNETVTLEGIINNPTSNNCFYQWYFLQGTSEIPVNNGNTPTIQVAQAGDYIFEVNCGACVLRDTFTLKACNDICVFDNIAPTVICMNGLVISLNGTGQAQIHPSDLNNGSFDNCEIDRMFLDKTTFDCNDAQQGSVAVTLTVIDKAGNMSSCVTSVIVQDHQNNCSQFCTQDIINLGPNTLFGNQQFVARRIVNTESTLAAGSNTYMQAKDYILFKPGFNALPNSTLTARIEDCTAPNLITKKEEIAIELITENQPDKNFLSLKIQPNPFKHQTTLVIDLTTQEKVNLEVFDKAGRLIESLVKEEVMNAGKHEILLTDKFLYSGMYFIRLRTATTHLIKKAIIIKDGASWQGKDD
jgi:PKD repeat protein